MYYEEAKLSGENILTVLYCAKKYMVSGLKDLCSEFLEEQLDHSNVCFILEQVQHFPNIFKCKNAALHFEIRN